MYNFDTRTRIEASLFAALLGDALGVPYEFTAAVNLPARENLEMQVPRGFHRSHSGTPEGTWSDDGAQILVLLDNLRANSDEPLDLHEFCKDLLAWRNLGRYTPDERVYDIGLQTAKALDALSAGAHPLNVMAPVERENGNGSLMRVLPVAFLQGTDAHKVRQARLQSIPTHPHLRSQLCCALYVLWVSELLKGASVVKAKAKGLDTLRALLQEPEEHAEFALISEVPFGLKGSGYVYDSLWSAWTAFEQSTDIKSCLQLAVAYGNDTDTTACIAGGLAGAYYGRAAIPSEWLRMLRGKPFVFESLANFWGD